MKQIRPPSRKVFTICCLFIVLLFSVGVGFAETVLEAPALPDLSSVQERVNTDYNWSLRNLNGDSIDFSAFKNRVVFIHFWATWCLHCDAQMNSIEKLYSRFAGNDDIQFVLASYQGDQIVSKYIKKKKFTLPIYMYSKAVPRDLGPHRRIPRTFIINRQGQIVFKHIGAARWDDESVVSFLETLR